MATTEVFGINITQTQKTALRKRAAMITARTGNQVTMSDLVRDLIDQLINTPVETGSDDKANAIKFTPLPHVAKAIKQAHLNSGKPVSDVVNEMLVESLQAQGVM